MSLCDAVIKALYKQRLEAVKRGLPEPDMSIVFSGKGYHDAVYEPESLMYFHDRGYDDRQFGGYPYTMSDYQSEPFIILGGPLSV